MIGHDPQIIFRRKEVGMKDIITSILTDESARDSAAVEEALLDQAAATPWSSEQF
jgi:hypothetical protein